MENKRILEDVPTETLLAKLRRANASMTEAISCELLCRQTFFKPGTENKNLPSIVNVTLSDNPPKIQYPDFPPKQSEGFKFIYDESGVIPIIAEYTHYRNLKSNEEFFTEAKKQYSNVDIYDTCATCGNLTKNDICKECSK